MFKAYAFALACAALMSSCLPKNRAGTCNAIDSATRVVVHVSSQGAGTAPDYVITDQERIRQLIAFTNVRRAVSRPSLYTMPAGTVDATFYENAEFVGTIGAGANFFFLSCTNWKGTRNATATELDDFKRLISPKY